MNRFLFVLSLFAAASSAVGCVIEDEDRCPKGWNYIKKLKVCCPDDHIYDDNSGICRCPDGYRYGIDGQTCEQIEAPSSDTGAGDLDGGADGGDGTCKPGLGTSCTVPGDCAALCEDFCAFNPLKMSGYCTTTDCDASNPCPGGYRCCDCAGSTVLPQEIACLTDADADLAGSAAGCICE